MNNFDVLFKFLEDLSVTDGVRRELEWFIICFTQMMSEYFYKNNSFCKIYNDVNNFFFHLTVIVWTVSITL